MRSIVDECIGERIRYRREQLELSQEELAKKLGYKSRSTIDHMENGDVDINSKKIQALAKALETTSAFLLGWEDVDEQEARKIRFMSRYEELSDLEQAMVRKIMNCDENFNKLGGKG